MYACMLCECVCVCIYYLYTCISHLNLDFAFLVHMINIHVVSVML